MLSHVRLFSCKIVKLPPLCVATMSLPIPPPPPHGWSGLCKTVISPIEKKEESQASDAVAVRVIEDVRATKDSEAEKKNKTDKKVRQKAKKGSQQEAQ